MRVQARKRQLVFAALADGLRVARRTIQRVGAFFLAGR